MTIVKQYVAFLTIGTLIKENLFSAVGDKILRALKELIDHPNGPPVHRFINLPID